jgi:hypothetical protein
LLVLGYAILSIFRDPPAFRQMAGRAPEKIVFEFFGTRLFETENFAALRIDSGHDVADGRRSPFLEKSTAKHSGWTHNGVEPLQRTQFSTV